MTQKKPQAQAAFSALVLVVLAFCLLPGTAAIRSAGWLGVAFAEAEAVFRDAEMQWMVLSCAVAYFVAFTSLARRVEGAPFWRLRNPDLWLVVGLVLAALHYACDYADASKSTLALTLVGGAVLGKGVCLGAGWRIANCKSQIANRRLQTANGKSESGKGAGGWEGRRQKAKGRSVAGPVMWALVVLLAAAAAWQAEAWHRYEYHGQARWTGPWDKPNTFGVLMGVGAVLAVGCALRRWMIDGRGWRIEDKGSKTKHRTLNPERRTLNWRKWGAVVFYLVAAGVMGVGLVRSYSRGAWLGTAVGVVAMLKARGQRPKKDEPRTLNVEHRTLKIERRTSKRFPLAVIVLSVAVLASWSLRHVEGTVARRAASVANANDFSWRNRVAAWEGTLQMMAERPWLGHGWNQPEPVYGGYYRPSGVAEGAAIQMNDYFMLGAALGAPALFCFGMYIWLAISQKSKIENRKSKITEEEWLKAICRAGAIVLLVGFWFDGGLFKLATASVFWILIELGREDGEGLKAEG